MCGRYLIITEDEIIEMKAIIDEINSRFGRMMGEPLFKTGEIFPTDIVPVLVNDNNRVAPVLMKWGFSRWDQKGQMINAREETVFERPMFRDAVMKNRCVVPANAFFEWSHNEKKKPIDKYSIWDQANPMLYMAGIYKQVNGKDEFTILTREADGVVCELHDRMPVLMNRSDISVWLGSPMSLEVFKQEKRELVIQKESA